MVQHGVRQHAECPRDAGFPAASDAIEQVVLLTSGYVRNPHITALACRIVFARTMIDREPDIIRWICARVSDGISTRSPQLGHDGLC